MARRTKEAAGRVTPKGTRPAGRSPARAGARAADAGTRVTTGRYTAPQPEELKASPWWVPALILALIGVGVLVILLDYLGLLPASPNNWYLIGGLIGVVLGFVVATRWH